MGGNKWTVRNHVAWSAAAQEAMRGPDRGGKAWIPGQKVSWVPDSSKRSNQITALGGGSVGRHKAHEGKQEGASSTRAVMMAE